MAETVGTVREREREREHNSNELSFICDAQNVVFTGFEIVEKIYTNRKKDGLCSNIKDCYIVCPFCVF